jgi:hypothetical protein
MNVKNKIFVFAVMGMAACVRPPDYPIEPQISFSAISKNTMRQGTGQQDSVWLTIAFTDGDGDLGNKGTDRDSVNVFVIDKRKNQQSETFRIPYVPDQGAGNGISGDIKLLLFTTCCDVIPPCEPSITKPIDTLVYQISIKDRAGHKSNVVETPNIYLQCR